LKNLQLTGKTARIQAKAQRKNKIQNIW